MKRIFIILAAVVITTGMKAQDEIGIIAGGINGLSYKHWFSEKVAIQTDLAVGLTAAPMGIYAYGKQMISGTKSLYDFTLNPNLLGHLSIIPNLQFYGGPGVNLGLMSDLHNTNPDLIMGKFGINGVLGLAYDLPLVVLALDFRPGYGLGFRDANLLAHFFDWKVGLAVRYRF